MEQYLIDDYDVIEDKRYLTSEDNILEYFKDNAYDFFDCGQGYYQDEADLICKIDDEFFEVKITAEIGSSKQDRGDRLYWIDYIDSVEYKEISKPLPKEKIKLNYEMNLTQYQKNLLESFLSENGIKFILKQ